MPELPEVETVKRILETQIIGKRIKEVKVYYEKILENVDVETFKKELINEQICSLTRRGKYLIIVLTKHTLVVHLRMEGKFFIKNLDEKIEKHEHLEFVLEDVSLRYHDTRKFGKIALVNSTDMNVVFEYQPLKKLGVDANIESDFIKIHNLLAYKKCTIKEALLDQTNVAGLGNIYVDEVCFLSKIHPQTKCNELAIEDIKNILLNSKKVLDAAVLQGGTTIRSYTSSLGVTGRFQNSLLVHQRENQPCPVCNTKIKKIRVGGRGTYFCPTCQVKAPDVKVVGITGVIGSGKTTFTNILEEMGYYVIDCDVINREILMKDHPNYPTLVKYIAPKFPWCIKDNEIDRRLLRESIFQNEYKRKQLQAIIFGFIKYEIVERLEKYKTKVKEGKAPNLVFLSAPLLFESGFYRHCEEIIIIDANHEVMLNRIMERDDLTKEEAERAIELRSNFMTIALKSRAVKKNPIIIYNNESIENLKKKAINVIKDLKED